MCYNWERLVFYYLMLVLIVIYFIDKMLEIFWLLVVFVNDVF